MFYCFSRALITVLPCVVPYFDKASLKVPLHIKPYINLFFYHDIRQVSQEKEIGHFFKTTPIRGIWNYHYCRLCGMGILSFEIPLKNGRTNMLGNMPFRYIKEILVWYYATMNVHI
jgi:hypothetical protein